MNMTWHARYPDEATCIRCLVVKPVKELDRLLLDLGKVKDVVRVTRAARASAGKKQD